MQRFWKTNTHWGRDFIKDALRRRNEGGTRRVLILLVGLFHWQPGL